MSRLTADVPGRAGIIRQAAGIALYAGAFGATFGAVAVASGFSVLQACVMSLLMFTGASQFAFAGVLATGAAPMAAVPAALLLGVRNTFYGVPVSEIERPHGWRRFVTAHFVIDESTAMAVAQSEPQAQRFAFWATALSLFSLWQTGTLVGASLGSAVDPATFGLDVAGPAVFLALMWPQLTSSSARLLAVVGAIIGFVLIPYVPAGIPVILAGALAIAVGLFAGGGPTDGSRE